ncbi:ChrR family anti-sigma-E factor [Rhodanobacter sp. C01]|uniref:ChrR family anti-sigma-E factor n=1 Tax=Rhodanobacter sp. C01 TaxID=1945856 RepID=UPI0009850C63|nr:ChrR family anti-sigma-E factor [Rhodanobacter sp. C01]OOG46817.1 transcriptional regulator [Rhodanobacter sp. C01]
MKPTHHLDDATLLSYSSGALPAALAVVASTHLECCAACRAHLLDADQIGGMLMQQQRVDAPAHAAREVMLALLDAEPAIQQAAPPPDIVEEHDLDRLPSALHPWFGHSMRALRWRRVAPGVQRIRATGIGGGDLMLLRIAPGSKLPLHSHGGSELTVILDGAYDDMLGHFGPGDVADLDSGVHHQPVTSPGLPCICVAATDAPLVFSGWIARTLQPLFGF